MTLSSQRAPWLVVALVLLTIAALGVFGAQHSRLSTDVLDLLPEEGQAAELRLLRAAAAGPSGASVWFVFTASEPAEARAAAALASESFQHDKAVFREATVWPGLDGWKEAGRVLDRERWTLLFPRWLREHLGPVPPDSPEAAKRLTEAVASDLDAFFLSPEATAASALARDPLLLTWGSLQRQTTLLADSAGLPAVWALPRGSAFLSADQQALERAISNVRQQITRAHPGVTMSWTGVSRFAQATEAKVRSEVFWLNLLSPLAVFGFTWWWLRRPSLPLHAILVSLVSSAGALAVTMSVFSQVHVLALAFGSLLAGVAVDYVFHVILHLAPPGQGSWRERVRSVLPPLLGGYATTLAGFLSLLFSDLPVLQQGGVFLAAGLTFALILTLSYGSLFARAAASPVSAANGTPSPRANLWAKTRWIFAVLAVASTLGLLRSHWDDSIQSLSYPLPGIRSEDAFVRGQFGSEISPALCHGANRLEAVEAWGRLETWAQTRSLPPPAGLGLMAATAADSALARRFSQTHPDWAAQVLAALDKRGYVTTEFAGFADSWETARQAGWAAERRAAAWSSLLDALQGPSLLLHGSDRDISWLAAAFGPGTGLTDLPPGTFAVSQVEVLGNVFGSYRQAALKAGLLALGLVLLCLFGVLGPRGAVGVFAAPVAGVATVFGLFSWWGVGLDLFHLLGATQSVCLALDIAIFSAHARKHHSPWPVSITVAAFTTIVSFAVLAFSGLPALRHLGLTVAASVTVSYVFARINFEHRRGSPGP